MLVEGLEHRDVYSQSFQACQRNRIPLNNFSHFPCATANLRCTILGNTPEVITGDEHKRSTDGMAPTMRRRQSAGSAHQPDDIIQEDL
jgi:hypothetical protein